MKILYATDGSAGGLTPARFFARLPHREDVHIHMLDAHGFASIDAVRGILSVQKRITDPSVSERTGYINTIRPLLPEGEPAQAFL